MRVLLISRETSARSFLNAIKRSSGNRPVGKFPISRRPYSCAGRELRKKKKKPERFTPNSPTVATGLYRIPRFNTAASTPGVARRPFGALTVSAPPAENFFRPPFAAHVFRTPPGPGDGVGGRDACTCVGLQSRHNNKSTARAYKYTHVWARFIVRVPAFVCLCFW